MEFLVRLNLPFYHTEQHTMEIAATMYVHMYVNPLCAVWMMPQCVEKGENLSRQKTFREIIQLFCNFFFAKITIKP